MITKCTHGTSGQPLATCDICNDERYAEAIRLLESLVTEAEKWIATPNLQEQGSLQWWLKDELREARLFLKEKQSC